MPAEDYPDGCESDSYDDDADHFCSFDEFGDLVGYVRLVRPGVDRRFPLDDHCVTLADGIARPDPRQSAEISRLILRQDYRRLRHGPAEADGHQGGQRESVVGARRTDSARVLLDLYRQMYQHSLRSGVRYWYAAMERPLARGLQRLNFTFQQLGPETDYYGPVAPYLADLRDLEQGLSHSAPDLLAWMKNLQPHTASHWHMSRPGIRALPLRRADNAPRVPIQYPPEHLRHAA